MVDKMPEWFRSDLEAEYISCPYNARRHARIA
jgi:hypothetical protein